MLRILDDLDTFFMTVSLKLHKVRCVFDPNSMGAKFLARSEWDLRKRITLLVPFTEAPVLWAIAVARCGGRDGSGTEPLRRC